MHYCKSLKFSERPDYTFLRRLFTDLMDKLGYQKDYVFDWCRLDHSVKFENGSMTLAIRNKHSDLEAPYVTLASGDINLNDININICEEIQEAISSKEKETNNDPEEGNIEE